MDRAIQAYEGAHRVNSGSWREERLAARQQAGSCYDMAKCYRELSPERVRSVRNETIAVVTEVCTLRLEVPVLESE